jgi:hypothetical protein
MDNYRYFGKFVATFGMARPLILALLVNLPNAAAAVGGANQVERISLDGAWRMTHVKPGEGNRLHDSVVPGAPGNWIACTVPGTAQAAMLEAGKIADPFFGRNSLDMFWMEHDENLPGRRQLPG